MKSVFRSFIGLLAAALILVPMDSSISEIARNPGWQIRQATENGVEMTLILPSIDSTSIRSGAESFTHFSIAGFNHLAEPGQPALPVSGQLLVVPQNARVTTKFHSLQILTIENTDIAPARDPETESAEAVPEKNQQIYTTDDYFPQNPVWAESVKIVHGIPVTILWIAPVQYNPVRHCVRIYREVEISVQFAGGDGFVFPSQKQSSIFNRILASLARNWPETQTEFGSELYPEGPDYLIITHDAFKEAADSLARWREETGHRPQIALTSEIGASAEAIQQFIRQTYTSGNLTNLLLLGDVEFIPTCYKKSAVDLIMEPVATDLPYVTVDGDDDFPDICLGRISVDSFTEAMNFVRKIIQSEKYPVADPAFFTRAALAAQFEDRMDSTHQPGRDGYEDHRFVLTSEEIHDFLVSAGYSATRIYTAGSNVNPTHYNNTGFSDGAPLPTELLRSQGFLWNGSTEDILREIGAGCFLLTHRDHGSPDGWKNPPFRSAQVKKLVNGNRLPVVFSINCSSGWFDNEIWGLPEDESFAETWARNPKGGALGVVAASRTSFSGVNDALCHGLIGAIWPEFLATTAEPIRNLGGMLVFSKIYLATQYPETNLRQLTFQIFHCFGDPASTIWTQRPRSFTVQPIERCTFGQSRLAVDFSEPDATVALRQNNKLLASTVSNYYGRAILTFPPIESYQALQLTIQKPDFRPWVSQLGVQNASGTCLLVEIENFLEENGDGHVNIGEVIQVPVRIQNTGSIPIEQIQLRLSCPDTFLVVADSVIQIKALAIGASVTETVTFRVRPDCPHGRQSQILIFTSAPDYATETTQNFRIIEGGPVLRMAESLLKANVIAIGESKELFFQITNAGFGSLNVVLDSLNDSWLQCRRQEVNLNHKEQAGMLLQFFAVKPDTQFSTRLKLRCNAPNQPEILLPVHFFVGTSDFQIIADTGQIADCNGDFKLNPGEEISLPVFLRNLGTASARNVCVSLELNHPCVQTPDLPVTIPEICAGEAISLAPFSFTISNICPDGQALNFEIQFTVDNSYSARTKFAGTIQDASPEIFLKTTALDLSIANGTDSLNLPLKVHNRGYGMLRFSVKNPEDCQFVCQPANQVWLHKNGGAGNILQFTHRYELVTFQSYMKIDSSAILNFFIYTGDSLTGEFHLLAQNQTQIDEPGTGWYASQPFNCVLTPDQYYFLGTSWSGAAWLGMSSATLPTDFEDGQVLTGTLAEVGFPPQPIVKQTKARFQPVAQLLIKKSWIEIPQIWHKLVSLSDTEIEIQFHPGGADSIFRTELLIESNDPANGSMTLPVALTVGHPANILDGQSGEPLQVADLVNFPNPIHTSTRFRYRLNQAAAVEISLYNLLGQQVWRMTKEFQSPGFYNEFWSGQDPAGRPVSSGIYLVVLRTASVQVVRKVVVVR